MNIEKAKLKMLIANDLGADLEDRLDGERRTANELAGAASGLKQAAIKIQAQLAARADEDEVCRDGMEEHEVRKIVKQYITRACDFMNHLGAVEEQKAIAQGGRVEGIQQAMELVQKVRDTEAKNIQRLIAAVEATEAEEIRTPSEAAKAAHGGAADRKAEAEAASKKKAAATRAAKKVAKKKATKKAAKKK